MNEQTQTQTQTQSTLFASREEQLAAWAPIADAVFRHARHRTRGWKCEQTREDVQADAQALAWRWFVEADSRGKNIGDHPMGVAILAVKSALGGRKVSYCSGSRDAMLRRAPTSEWGCGPDDCEQDDCGSPWERCIFAERNTWSPGDAAAFRIDWAAFLAQLPARDVSMMDDLIKGMKANVVAEKYGITPGRVTQKRHAWRDAWAISQA